MGKIRDRVVQGALKLILEPVFEADFQEGSYGYRPQRTAHEAVEHVATEINRTKIRVIDVDLRNFFDNVRHHILLEKVAQRIDDPKIMRLLKLILKASGKKGIPQGGVVSPLLSNIYLQPIDAMLEKAKKVTRNGEYTRMEYARYADDLVILIDGRYRQRTWLVDAVARRLREELGKLQIEVNEEKSRIADLAKGEKFGFLGFELRWIKGRSGKMRPDRRPQMKQRTALLSKLKGIFRKWNSQPIKRVIEEINPILRGWVTCFAIGNSGKHFSYIREWVEKKVRRHLMRACKRHGFGWKRWSKTWLYDHMGLFHGYHVRYYRNSAAVSAIQPAT